MSEPLLRANITVDYPGKPGVLRDFQLKIASGEIVGLVGESGSGKTTAGLAIPKLLPYRGGTVTGQVLLQGRDLLTCPEGELRRLRGKAIAFVPQGASSSLNPALRIGSLLKEAWHAHSHDPLSGEYVQSLLRKLELPVEPEFLKRFPSQISIGQAQRILIAMAVMHKPALLIADEPTSALDLINQAQVLRLMRTLSSEQNTAVLFISHDLLSVAALCDRILILKDGVVVESGPTAEVFTAPRHDYTRSLLKALPTPAWHTPLSEERLHAAV